MSIVDDVRHSLLLVDDEENVLNSLSRLFRPLNCTVETALSAEDALTKMAATTPDIVISDVRMPGMDGIQLLRIIARDYPETERVLLTAYTDIGSTIEAINSGGVSHYVQKPWDGPALLKWMEKTLVSVSLRRANKRLQEKIKEQNSQLKHFSQSLEEKVQDRTHALNAVNKQLEEKNQSLKNSYHNFVELFMRLLASRLGVAYQNDHLTSRLAVNIGKALGLHAQELVALHYATKLRYVGLLELKDDVLGKVINDMDSKELRAFNTYPQLSYALLSSQPALFPAAEIILAHREQLNGGGYPGQLPGDKIGLPAKILAVVSMFEVLTKGQQIDEQFTTQHALAYLHERIGSHYSDKVVSALVAYMEANSDYDSERRLTVADLEPSMVLSRDLNNQQDSLLLARGTLLEPAVISLLNNLDGRLSEGLVLYVYL